MKTKSIIIAAVALLAFAPAASAQKKIKEAFENVVKHNGVTQTGEQKSSATDSTGITCESRIIFIKVKADDFAAVVGKLQNAFDSEKGNASMSYTHKVDSNVEDTGTRQQWSISREGANPVLVGAIKNSCYMMGTFDDKHHPGYRTCLAAEWSDTDNTDMRSARLTYVYGRKPNPQTARHPINYYGSVQWPNRLPDIAPNNLQDILSDFSRNDLLSDSLIKQRWEQIEKYMSKPKDILFKDGHTQEWLNQAMNNVKHLSASDWQRFFGILTQKMIDRADKKSAEDLVVAAGLVLDLCKNADQLDAEERRISALRLTDVAEHFDSDQSHYVHDMLMLGAKILEKNE